MAHWFTYTWLNDAESGEKVRSAIDLERVQSFQTSTSYSSGLTVVIGGVAYEVPAGEFLEAMSKLDMRVVNQFCYTGSRNH